LPTNLVKKKTLIEANKRKNFECVWMYVSVFARPDNFMSLHLIHVNNTFK